MKHNEREEDRLVWFVRQGWKYGWGLLLVAALTLLSVCSQQLGGFNPSNSATPIAGTSAAQTIK